MDRTGARILLAQKAFSMYALYPLIGEYLCGATASGLYEARLCAEEMAKPLRARGRKVENHIFSPAYKETEFREILRCPVSVLHPPDAALQPGYIIARPGDMMAAAEIDPSHAGQVSENMKGKGYLW